MYITYQFVWLDYLNSKLLYIISYLKFTDAYYSIYHNHWQLEAWNKKHDTSLISRCIAKRQHWHCKPNTMHAACCIMPLQTHTCYSKPYDLV